MRPAMAPEHDAWQRMLQAAQDDPEACHALGQLLFAIKAALGHPSPFPTLEAANAYAHALQFATHEAILRSEWRASSQPLRNAPAPFRPTHLATSPSGSMTTPGAWPNSQ